MERGETTDRNPDSTSGYRSPSIRHMLTQGEEKNKENPFYEDCCKP